MVDVDDDGREDAVSAASTAGNVYWLKRPAPPSSTWTQYTVGTGLTKIEGAVAGDFDGDGEVEIVVLDQTPGDIVLYKPQAAGVPTGTWDAATIQGSRVNCQDAQAIDIDGDGIPEIVYTWEGDADGQGGVNWLDWTGGDVTDPANWTDHVMVQHNGAWWLGSSGRLDLTGDGNETDIVFSARDSGRNAATVPGIYWLEPPTPVTNTWTEHTIDNSDTDWLHVDSGDFSGAGHSKDVCAHDMDQSQGPCWWEYDDSWTKHALTSPDPLIDSWNMRRVQLSDSLQDDILFITGSAGDGSIYIYEYRDGSYQSCELEMLNYDHPMDDRLFPLDIDRDGKIEVIIADSGGDRLAYLDFH